jgi:hypothetical protein
MNPLKGDGLADAERDHRVAVSIVCQIGLDVAKARNIVEANQVDFVRRDIEAVDNVVADRLSKHKLV